MHPWFQEAVTYLRSLEEGQEPDTLECKYVDYYNFAKDKASKGTYHKVDNTDWYYEGVFVEFMPDLNLTNETVRKEIEDVAKFWLDLGVSGFRLDAAKEYFSGAHTKNIEVLSWFNTYVKSVNPDAYIVGEVWDSFGTIASYYESGIDSVFNYAFGDSAGKIATTVRNVGNGKAGYSLAQNLKQVQDIFKTRNENFIEASFISNHDNNRAISFVGGDENLTKLMGGINLMMNGSSFIYYGEEIGMAGTGRDENKRAPMYWSEDDLTGITSGPANMERQEQIFEPVDQQDKNAASILNYYKRAIRIRNQNPELLRGEIEVIEGLDKNIAAVKKTYDGKSILILMNINEKESIITLSREQYGYEGIEAALTTTEVQPTIEGDAITLPPYGIVILR
jgi:glycosidase